MTRSPALRDHVAVGLLDVAAAVLAERGADTSMSDLAKAAGVSRATLYRYFPNREALLTALADTAIADLSGRIADARLDTVPAPEALARLTRAMLGVVSKYRALGLFGKTSEDEAEAQQAFAAPIHALFERGARDGAFRPDLPARTLAELYISLLEGAIQRTLDGRLGAEEASAAITTVFLSGAGAAVAPDRQLALGETVVPDPPRGRLNGQDGGDRQGREGRCHRVMSGDGSGDAAEHRDRRAGQGERPQQHGGGQVPLAPAQRQVAGEGPKDDHPVRAVDGEHRQARPVVGRQAARTGGDIGTDARDDGRQREEHQGDSPSAREPVGCPVIDKPGPPRRRPESGERPVEDCQYQQPGGCEHGHPPTVPTTGRRTSTARGCHRPPSRTAAS